MRVWNFEREEADTAFADSYDRIRDAQFSDDGDRVITVSPGAARIWQAATGQPLSERIRGSGIESGQFSPNGKAIMLLSDDGTLTVCDARKGIPVTEPIKLDSSPTTSHSIDGDPVYEDISCFPKLSPDGKLIAAPWDDKQVQVREADTLDLAFAPIQHGESVSFVQFSPDSSRIVTSSKNTVQVWESRTGQALTGPMTHSARVGSVQFTPDGERIVTTLVDGPAQVWNARTGEQITAGAQSDESIALIRLNRDGKRSVTVSKENAVTVWDIEPRHMVGAPIQFPGKIEVVEFSPDGQRLVTASNETAQVWDVASGKPIGEPMKPGAKVSSAEFSPDGSKVVTASGTETAIIWDAFTGKQLTPVMKMRGRGLARFSPNGKLLVTGMCGSCDAELWDATTGFLVSETLPHGKGYSRILDVQFSSDSQQILATERNRTARIHDLVPAGRGPQWLLQLADTLAGKHLDDRDIFHPLGDESLELLNKVKGEVKQPPFEDGWVRWGRWFLADRSVRTISPFSKITVSQYIENRIKENTTESLDEAEQLASGNPDLTQRIAHAKGSLAGRQ
jgi:WD40 repeat protein